MNGHPRLVFGLCVFALICASLGFTRFSSPQSVLAQHNWGADTPSSSWITAFATGRPFWIRLVPEAVVVTQDGGIEPYVEVPREDIRAKGVQLVLPSRSIGYYAFLGLVTSIRSILSESLIFDFALIVRLQQLFLVAAILGSALMIFSFLPQDRRGEFLVLFTGAFCLLLGLRPNKDIFLAEGIIDSALAVPASLVAVVAFIAIVRNLELTTKRSVAMVTAASLYLGYATLIRGEFALVCLFVYAFVAASRVNRAPFARGLALSVLVFALLPTAYGCVNKAVFGRFVPFRLQAGQNLVEPIGEFQNPYGIEYSDEWAYKHLEDRGIEYLSFEADDLFTNEYKEYLFHDPLLFIRNFFTRLSRYKFNLALVFNAWTLPVFIPLMIWLSRRDERFLVVAQPGAIAIGYLLFGAWFNDLTRVVAPAHYLTHLFACFAIVYFASNRRKAPNEDAGHAEDLRQNFGPAGSSPS